MLGVGSEFLVVGGRVGREDFAAGGGGVAGARFAAAVAEEEEEEEQERGEACGDTNAGFSAGGEGVFTGRLGGY